MDEERPARNKGPDGPRFRASPALCRVASPQQGRAAAPTLHRRGPIQTAGATRAPCVCSLSPPTPKPRAPHFAPLHLFVFLCRSLLSEFDIVDGTGLVASPQEGGCRRQGPLKELAPGIWGKGATWTGCVRRRARPRPPEATRSAVPHRGTGSAFSHH